MSKTLARVFVCLSLLLLVVNFAAAQTPLAPNSIQVSRLQYDGNNGNNYISPFGFPEIFGDQAGCNTGNKICNIAGIQGSIYIDQFSSVPLAPVAGTLSLPSTGAPATYPTVEPGAYITSSFSSKSEGALMISPNGNFLTYMGYEGNDQLDDVSNSYSPNVTYQLNPNTYTNSNGVPYPFYDREVALIGPSGLISLTPIDNAYSGDNPRAAITIDGNEFYTGGNSDSTTYPKNPPATSGPGLTIGVRCGIPLNSNSYQLGTYTASDRGDESNKQHYKDNNWRGIGIYTDANGNQQLYVAKGSGGNGDDGLFQVGSSLPTCTVGGTDTSNTITELPGLAYPVTNQTTQAATPILPFGFFFANPTTVYVADEGYQNTDANGNLIPDPYAGLEKYSLINGTWTLDYTIQAGLNLYQPETFPGYVDGSGIPITSYVTGLRNMTGAVNGDGTVTIYAITAQYSSVSSGEPDPTSLVGVTDSLAATTLPSTEQFVTVQTAGYQEVFRGVAYVPPAPGTQRQTQTINFTQIGTVTYGASPITLAANATSGWPIVYSLVSGPATLSGNVLTITGAGSVVVQADQSGNTDYAAAVSVQQTITVNPEATSVTWTTPAPITYGTQLSGIQLNASGSVAGTLTYNPPAGTILSAGTQTLMVTFTPSSNNYAPSTGSVMLQVNQATPTIAWSTPSPITYGTALSETQLNATANIAGSFVYTPPSGTVLNGGTQTLSVSFTPSDSVDYTTASSSVSLLVNPASQTVSFTTNAPPKAVYNTSFTVSATSSSGLPVVFLSSGSCSNSGATYNMTSGTGTCTVTASQPGNSNYSAAPSKNESTGAQLAAQTVSFSIPAPASALYGSTFTVAASSTSGLPVTYLSGGTCTNSSATYTLISGTGSCTVTASQPGNGNYSPAPYATEFTTAMKATPTTSFTGAPATAQYTASFMLIATTNSSSVAAITVNNPTACQLSGSVSPVTVNIVKSVGLCKFTATWNPDANYAGSTIIQSTTLMKAPTSVTWATPAAVSYGTALSSTQLDATSSQPGTLTYNPVIGAIEPAGTKNLMVTFKPTDTNYANSTATVALQIQQDVTVTTITSSSSIVNLNSNGVAMATLAFNVTSYKPTGAVTLTASTGEVCSAAVSAVTGNGSCKLTFTTTGTRTIIASYGGDANHMNSDSSGQTPAVTVTVNPH